MNDVMIVKIEVEMRKQTSVDMESCDGEEVDEKEEAGVSL